MIGLSEAVWRGRAAFGKVSSGEKRQFRTYPQAPFLDDYTGIGFFGQEDIVAKRVARFGDREQRQALAFG